MTVATFKVGRGGVLSTYDFMLVSVGMLVEVVWCCVLWDRRIGEGTVELSTVL
jgi:hypothetical protein